MLKLNTGSQPSAPCPLQPTPFLRGYTHLPSQWALGKSPKVKTIFLFPGAFKV